MKTKVNSTKSKAEYVIQFVRERQTEREKAGISQEITKFN